MMSPEVQLIKSPAGDDTVILLAVIVKDYPVAKHCKWLAAVTLAYL